MFLTTQAAAHVRNGDLVQAADGIGCSAVWAFMRTARMELGSRVAVLCMSTDAATMDGSVLASQLRHELKQGEGEVVYRGGVRHSLKLSRSTQHAIGPVALQLEKRGKLQDMEVVPQPGLSTGPKDEQVQVRVCAVGLNFKDLLNVLMPDEAAYLGEVPLPGADFRWRNHGPTSSTIATSTLTLQWVTVCLACAWKPRACSALKQRLHAAPWPRCHEASPSRRPRPCPWCS